MSVIAVVLIMFGLGCSRRVRQVQPEPSFTHVEASEVSERVADDLAEVKRYDAGLQKAVSYAKRHPELFPHPDDGAPIELSVTQRAELREIWRVMLDYMHALEETKQFWSGYRKVSDQKLAREFGFLIAYTAWLVQYRWGQEFVGLALPSEAVEKILDEPDPRHGIEEGSYSRVKWKIVNVEAITMHRVYRTHYQLGEDEIVDEECTRTQNCIWAAKTAERYHGVTSERIADSGDEFRTQTVDFFEDVTFGAWFPVQRNVAEWMGDTKYARPQSHLVDYDQIVELSRHLEPGDILVTRQNWYVSNVGLPGFWPHSAFYLGTPDQLREQFDEPDVRRALGRLTDEDCTEGVDCPEVGLVEYIRRTHPEAWEAYRSDEKNRVIEAVSEGVVFHPLSKTAAVDYLGALRPRSDDVHRALAIARAFSFHGKPYDFNFDFLTNEELVCTEVVYKPWKTQHEPDGLPIELTTMMGRTTLPANELVRQFDETYDDPDERIFDFVYFLDGRESEDDAVVRDVDAFRDSWKRPKWDTAQE